MTTYEISEQKQPDLNRDETEPVLRVQNLSVQYKTSAGPVTAVDDVSFTLAPGQRLALVGESGSGKTTLATALMRMTRPPGRIAGGSVLLGERDLTAMTDKQLRQLRLAEIALVPQGAMNSLNPVMRVGAQILDGIRAHPTASSQHWSKQQLHDRVSELLASVNLDPAVARLYPHELSGGMKQRVAIAIATSLHPMVIIADEPTSALDVVVQRHIMSTLRDLQEQLGAAVLLIGHDMGLVAQFADTVGVMYAGRLVELASVEDLFRNPLHPYTKLLIDSLPSLDEKRRLVGIPGLPPPLHALPAGCAFAARCPHAFTPCEHTRPHLQELPHRRRAACHLYPGHTSLDLDPSPAGEVCPDTAHPNPPAATIPRQSDT